MSLPLNYWLAAAEISYITRHAGAQPLADSELVTAVLDLPVLSFDPPGRLVGASASSGQPPPHPRGPEDLFRLNV